MSRMLAVLRESVSREQWQQVCNYESQGNVSAIETMYRKVVGQ